MSSASATHGHDGHGDYGPVTIEYGPPQPYHLVSPSPWPLFGSIAAGVTAVGAVVYMHTEPATSWLLILGGILIASVFVLWWRDVIKESVRQKAHSRVVKIGLRYGMMLFIASEVMFFAAFFWAFFDASLFPKVQIDSTWPPPGIAPFDPFSIPFLNTLILLLSGCTVTWAHHAIREGHQREATRALLITVLLGISFTSLQAYEYAHASFGFGDGIYSSTFFMATGFHGFHVIVGTIFLTVCMFRSAAGHFSPNSHFGFEAAAWYWHFVDAVWLFLFVCIYWWGAGDASFATH